MFNISICIPTYNRSRLLQLCLEHLASFSDTSFELIIGDNASEDDTQAIIASMRERFPNLVNLRHKTNVGYARNMDSISRRATRKYIYIISDDDLVFEGALKMSIGLLNANENVVAVVGKYLSFRKLDNTILIDYSDAVATIIPQGGQAAVFDIFMSIFDGHPVIRREIFQRHCSYLDRLGALAPLFFNLLKHGTIIAVDKPFFQHLTTTVSLSSRMAEAGFIDSLNADIELAVSGFLPTSTLHTSRQKLLQLLYLQAARMSNNLKDFNQVWLFLRRLMAVEGAPVDLLVNCEHHFSHDFLVDRISIILKDAELDTVHYIDTDISRTIVNSLSALLPQIKFLAYDVNSVTEGICSLICNQRSDASDTASFAPLIAINDLFEQYRLTQHKGCLASNNQRLFVQYEDSDVLSILMAPSVSFQIICAPYSELE